MGVFSPQHPQRLEQRERSGVHVNRSVAVKRIVSQFIKDNSGATAIEYALLASMIAVFLIAALNNLGTKLSKEFSEVGNALK